MTLSSELRGVVQWASPSNIAIVKYWGKRKGQLPQNASLSFTLSQSKTETQVSYFPRENKDDKLLRSFHFGGRGGINFQARVKDYLESMIYSLPILKKLSLVVETKNTFPHSCGVASSASGFSALALCLLEIQMLIKGENLGTSREGIGQDFWQKASMMARLGSGSACRSIYGPVSIWGAHPHLGSHDKFAIPFREAHPAFLGLRDAICLVDGKAKGVSSSLGHELMEDNPFAQKRYTLANERMEQLVAILLSGEIWDFIQLAEAEALALHGLMLLSTPPFLLLRPQSLAIMEKVAQFRRDHQIPVGLTMDAGPTVHILYFEQDRKKVGPFLQNEIAPLTQKIINDSLGEGPIRGF